MGMTGLLGQPSPAAAAPLLTTLLQRQTQGDDTSCFIGRTEPLQQHSSNAAHLAADEHAALCLRCHAAEQPHLQQHRSGH
ncbi:hypothetical protein COO60DRAFT_1581208 [Scenedesmus sp. NREL 46B-D3]|nr:hypothetical protein COO60DRAFT_1581208 [Scenedesmus sp. NREL 46B-D3]